MVVCAGARVTMMSRMTRALALLTLLFAFTATADVFIIREQGEIVGVEWIERSASETLVHSRFGQNAPLNLKYPGTEPIFVDQSIASVEQIMLRVRARRTPDKNITVKRYGSDETLVATVDIRGNAATVEIAGRRYELVLDRSLVRSGLIADHGISFERRSSFDLKAFPPAPTYATTGTVAMPKERKGRVPAVVMIGSSTDDVADALARRGFAVQRVASAKDATSAIAALRKREEIDPERIGVLGWGDAGAIATAADDPRVAFLILAGVPASGTDLAANARKVKAPVLVLQGATDRTTPPLDASRLGAMFAAAETALFAGLNHAFLPDPSGSGTAATLPSVRVSPRVTDTIASWITRKIAGDAAPRVP